MLVCVFLCARSCLLISEQFELSNAQIMATATCAASVSQQASEMCVLVWLGVTA